MYLYLYMYVYIFLYILVSSTVVLWIIQTSWYKWERWDLEVLTGKKQNWPSDPEWEKSIKKSKGSIRKRNPNTEKFNSRNKESRNGYRVKVGGVCVEGMMKLNFFGELCETEGLDSLRCTYEVHVWGACMPLPVPTPDLEVPTPSTTHCGPIRIFQGGPLIRSIPCDPETVWDVCQNARIKTFYAAYKYCTELVSKCYQKWSKFLLYFKRILWYNRFFVVFLFIGSTVQLQLTPVVSHPKWYPALSNPLVCWPEMIHKQSFIDLWYRQNANDLVFENKLKISKS